MLEGKGREVEVEVEGKGNYSAPKPPAQPKDASSVPAPAEPDGPAVVDAAQIVAAAVWVGRIPKPTLKFIAIRSMAARFLGAGWPPDRLTPAMIATPALTDAAVEFQLRGPTRSPTGAEAVIAELRAPIPELEPWP